jgi:hypothetical protein
MDERHPSADSFFAIKSALKKSPLFQSKVLRTECVAGKALAFLYSVRCCAEKE